MSAAHAEMITLVLLACKSLPNLFKIIHGAVAKVFSLPLVHFFLCKHQFPESLVFTSSFFAIPHDLTFACALSAEVCLQLLCRGEARHIPHLL